jgi:hypothetical protein
MHPLLVILAVVVALILALYYIAPLIKPPPLNALFIVVCVVLAIWVILATVGLVPALR